MSEWVELVEFPGYFVNRDGQVKGKRVGILKPAVREGYQRVNLWKDGIRTQQTIHRLVAKTFLPNPLNLPEVNHKDWNRSNNCVDNLEWVTQQYNRLSRGNFKNNTSGVKNIYWSVLEQKWIVCKQIKYILYQKRFNTFEEAEQFLQNIQA